MDACRPEPASDKAERLDAADPLIMTHPLTVGLPPSLDFSRRVLRGLLGLIISIGAFSLPLRSQPLISSISYNRLLESSNRADHQHRGIAFAGIALPTPVQHDTILPTPNGGLGTASYTFSSTESAAVLDVLIGYTLYDGDTLNEIGGEGNLTPIIFTLNQDARFEIYVANNLIGNSGEANLSIFTSMGSSQGSTFYIPSFTMLTGSYTTTGEMQANTSFGFEIGFFSGLSGSINNPASGFMQGESRITLVLVAVPEPSNLGCLAGLAALAIAATRRRIFASDEKGTV